MVEANIFIIHPEKDKKILDKLYCTYHKRTYGEVTLLFRIVGSEKGSQLGRDFGSLIRDEIDNSCFVIAIVTPNSKKSVWVNQEIGYAWSRKFVLPVKKKSLAEKGLGFIHSNIDAQFFHKDQKRFQKLDEFFEDRLGTEASKVVKKPMTVKPIKESARVPSRRVEPDVV